MIEIKVSDEIREFCPDFVGAAISAKVKNSSYNAELWDEINKIVDVYKSNYTIEEIKKIPVIDATRKAYKRLGKDPNRYRPSSEALCRRILRDLSLYQIDTLVDLVNMISVKTGYSIGGFDADKIEGQTLILGIGKEGEPYEAIGRGIFNIAGLPVYRDAVGGIGTPTSDNERTKIGLDTVNLLVIFNGYNGLEGLEDAVNFMKSSLLKYVDADLIESCIF